MKKKNLLLGKWQVPAGDRYQNGVQLEVRVKKQGENGSVTQFVICDLRMVICYPAAVGDTEFSSPTQNAFPSA
jgi:hypothetical protein